MDGFAMLASQAVALPMELILAALPTRASPMEAALMIFATTKLLPAAGTGVRFSTLFRAWTKLTFIDWAITLLQW